MRADPNALDALPLDAFPVVADFALRLDDSRHVELVSLRHGRLASFPGWDHADRDLRHFTAADVPLGAIDDPYDDRDEEWRILLFEHRGHVYVLEGDGPTDPEFPRFFRVPRERYLAAWAALIDAFNPILPLDDPTGDDVDEADQADA